MSEVIIKCLDFPSLILLGSVFLTKQPYRICFNISVGIFIFNDFDVPFIKFFALVQEVLPILHIKMLRLDSQGGRLYPALPSVSPWNHPIRNGLGFDRFGLVTNPL